MSIHFKTRALMYWEGGTSWREEEAVPYGYGYANWHATAYFEWPNGLFVRIHGLLLAQVMQRSSGINFLFCRGAPLRFQSVSGKLYDSVFIDLSD
ncbi:hypothetical protein L1887_21114 [Cichorium endivia]|nr:hypothetical protein L1887_21114 [Cichorium endivia]